MSLPADEEQNPATRRYRIVRRSLIIGSLFVLAGLLLTLSFSLLSIVDAQGQRLEQLEQRLQVAEMKNGDSLSREQWDEQLSKMRTQWTDLSRKQTTLSEALGQTDRRLDSLTQVVSGHDQKAQIEQLQSHQMQLEQALQSLHQTSTPPVSTAVPVSPLPPKNPKPRDTKTPTVVLAQQVPFKLTAIEYRGGRAVAALMPSDARQLTQIQLVREGQHCQGWTVTHIQSDHIRVQRQGRVVTLRLP